MANFQASLKNVFSSGLGGLAPPATLYVWPLFRFATPRAQRAEPGLADVVEDQVIPRLMRAHADPRDAANGNGAETAPGLAPEDRDAFLSIVLGKTLDAACDHVAALVRGGTEMSLIYAALLAPSARRLAELWDLDKVSYTDVTIGLGRLQQLIHSFSEVTPYNGDDNPRSAAAYFAPRPGEEHTFGFYVMEEMCRWSGWRTSVEPRSTVEEIRSSVRNYWYDMLCLSVTREARLNELRDTLQAIRTASSNPELCILVSGSAFSQRPALIEEVGADGAVSTGREALLFGEEALGRRHPA